MSWTEAEETRVKTIESLLNTIQEQIQIQLVNKSDLGFLINGQDSNISALTERISQLEDIVTSIIKALGT